MTTDGEGRSNADIDRLLQQYDDPPEEPMSDEGVDARILALEVRILRSRLKEAEAEKEDIGSRIGVDYFEMRNQISALEARLKEAEADRDRAYAHHGDDPLGVKLERARAQLERQEAALAEFLGTPKPGSLGLNWDVWYDDFYSRVAALSTPPSR